MNNPIDERICVMDVGNSNVKLYLTGGELPPEIKIIPTHCFSVLHIPKCRHVAATCVVPPLNKTLQDSGVFLITEKTPCSLDFSLMDTSTLGADRIANAEQLVQTGSLPAVSIDCGTAINAEIVGPSKQFCGGAILPGRKLIRKSLNLFTKQLPEIQRFDTLPPFPGQNTEQALRFGTDETLLAGVERLIEKAQKLFFGHHLRIVFCGGDRAFFLHNCRFNAEDGGANFTLKGIEAIFRRNIQGK